MCGLVGMAGNITTKMEKMFKFMLLFDVIRGEDSTGVAVVPRLYSEPKVEKELGHPINLWDWGTSSIFNFSGTMKGCNRVLIGHNRAATMGATTTINAHPFTFGKITGAHNGTLTDWRDLEGYKELDVDSKALFKTINEKGVAHAWENFLGAAAITYWDEEEETLNIVRNSQRPLCFSTSEDGKTLFWASEPWMISVAASKAGVKLTQQNDSSKISSFDIDKHFVFSVDTDSFTLVSETPLKKKFQSMGQQNGIRTITGFGIGNKSSKVGIKPINLGWARGLKKAEKSVRGKIGKLVGIGSKGQEPHARKFAIIKLNDDSRLEVYPKDEAELTIWEQRLSAPSTLYYRLKHRPRIKEDKENNSFCYRVAHDGVSLSHSLRKNTPETAEVFKLYRGIDGTPIVKEDWDKMASNLSPSHSCSHCTSTFTIEDHDKIRWVNKDVVFCEECASNTELMNLVYYENRA